MEEKFRQLSELGAGDFEHLDGSLIDHLNGTKALLERWAASKELQDAGLYHAAYGTAGFSEHLVATSQRHKIAGIIGKRAESIVYLYCACDRDFFWPQFGKSEPLVFKNRFNEESFQPSTEQVKDFCELTVANELEIAQGNSGFIEQSGAFLLALFTNMRPWLSKNANLSVHQVLGGVNA